MKPTVALATGSDADKRVREALALIGGMRRFVSPGQTVFIKPNLVFPQPPPQTTDPVTVATLVRLAREAGASRVWVGDSPSSAERRLRGLSSADVLEKTGLAAAVREAGGEVCLLDQDEVVHAKIPGAAVFPSLPIYRTPLEADVLISVPIMKTHYLTDVTLGVKCLYGLVSPDFRKQYHRDDMNLKLVDLWRLFHPGLTVIDAGMAMQGLGPSAGYAAPLNLTIAGQDGVACDAVASSLMGFDPLQIDHLRMAAYEGLGVARLDEIATVGKSPEEVRQPFVRPDLRLNGIFPGVLAIEGGVCRECRGRSRWILESLNKKGLLDGANRVMLILGVNPYVPDLTNLCGVVAVIGGCAAEAVHRLYPTLPANVTVVEGCPPDLAPRIVPVWIEEVIGQQNPKR